MNNNDFIKKVAATAGAAITIASAGAGCVNNEPNIISSSTSISSEENSDNIANIDDNSIAENTYLIYSDNWYLVDVNQINNYSSAIFTSSIKDLHKFFPGFNPNIGADGNYEKNEISNLVPKLSEIQYYFLESTYVDDTGDIDFVNKFSVTKRNPDGTDKYLLSNVFPDIVSTYETTYEGKECISSVVIDLMNKYYCYGTPELAKLYDEVNNFNCNLEFTDNFIKQFNYDMPDEMLFDPNKVEEVENRIKTATFLLDSYKDKQSYYQINSFVASTSLDGYDIIPSNEQMIAYRYLLLNKNNLSDDTKKYLTDKYHFDKFDTNALSGDVEGTDDIFISLCSSKEICSYYEKSNNQFNSYSDCLNAMNAYYSINDSIKNSEIIKYKLLINVANYLYRNYDNKELFENKIAFNDNLATTMCFGKPIHYNSFDEYFAETKNFVYSSYKKPDSYVTVINPDQVVYIYSNEDGVSRER